MLLAVVKQFLAPEPKALVAKGAVLELCHQANAFSEGILRKRRLCSAFQVLLGLSEKFETFAVVEDEERSLAGICAGMPVYAFQARAKAGTSANHLPEFGSGTDNKVDAFGNIDTGVHHVHGNDDVRGLVGNFEVVDNSLGITVVTDDAIGPFAPILEGIVC